MILNARASNRIYRCTPETRPGESFAFTYNKRNRLSAVTRNSVAYATYGYNALEQLTTRTTTAPGGPTALVAYSYDRDGHLITEAVAATGVELREYIWLPSNDNNPVDLPLAVIDVASNTISFVHADHLGRPIRMTDAAKAAVWQATWKPWGEIQTLTSTQTLNLRTPGQYFQIETGLHYNHHRTYDPVTGRYTQPDPLRFVDGPSVYAYAGNSPYMYTDRTGLIKLPNDPSGLPNGWTKDEGHKNPNGERYNGPNGETLEWHKGQPGKPGWRGKNHWHHNNGDTHLPPGTELPDPESASQSQMCGTGCQIVGVCAVAIATACAIAEPCGAGALSCAAILTLLGVGGATVATQQ